MFQIIHEWLDRFNTNFGIDYKTTIPLITTFGIFALGWTLTGISNSIKKSKKRKAVKQTLQKNLKVFETSLKKEIKSSYTSSRVFLNKTSESFRIAKVDFPHLSIFKEIGYQELFNTFNSGLSSCFNSSLRSRAVTQLWEIIIHINDQQEYIKTQLDNFNILNNRQIELFNKALMAYIEYVYKLLIDIENLKNAEEREYVSKLNQIHANWSKIENPNYEDIIHEHLVEKSTLLNQQYINVAKSLVFPSSILLNDINLVYRNRQHLLNTYSGLYIISYNFYLMNLRRVRTIRSILFPSFKQTAIRFFHHMKKAKDPKRPISDFRFMPESKF